jgi:hypothetical protein
VIIEAPLGAGSALTEIRRPCDTGTVPQAR